jgi:hypothetical protein
MSLGATKLIAGYVSASAAALAASVKLACIFGGQMAIAFSGSFFR